MFASEKNEMYCELINAIKALSLEKRSIKSSSAYKVGNSLVKKASSIKESGIKGIYAIMNSQISFRRGKKYSMASPLPNEKDYGTTNYFSDDRIAVYTCITGGYDTVVEPLFVPDNCDYYAITDFELPIDSKWKRININNIDIADCQNINDSPTLLNRFFKMNPHYIFEDYRYSIYVDGNIRICTDMTEYINRLSDVGIGTFAHSQRRCAYKEAMACIAMGKESKENIEKLVNRLQSEGLPEDYGLSQCSIIAREHNTELCKSLMTEWWIEFCTGAKRDQLTFPLVMFRHGIEMDKIATLGANVYNCASFEILQHRK